MSDPLVSMPTLTLNHEPAPRPRRGLRRHLDRLRRVGKPASPKDYVVQKASTSWLGRHIPELRSGSVAAARGESDLASRNRALRSGLWPSNLTALQTAP